jgi:hypothetical protein
MVGLIYIHRGTFQLTLRQKLKAEPMEFSKVTMVQGDYLDCEKIEREYDMVLDSF